MNNIPASQPNSMENEEAEGFTLASYNLTLGKWVCPKPDDPKPQEAQQTLPLPIDIVPNVRAVSLELCLLTFQSLTKMFFSGNVFLGRSSSSGFTCQ